MSVLEWCAVVATSVIAAPFAFVFLAVVAFLSYLVVGLAVGTARARWRRWRAERAARKLRGWR